jgi:dTDP-4-amino-4,6-dideoxygalactose transaminase
MENILRIASSAGIPVIEDNAHGLFGKRGGRYLGSFAPLATQSFHETKNFFCGEGGALVINEAAFVDRAEVLWKRVRIESGFSKVLWTSIHGSMWDRASCLQTCLLRSSMRNWKLGMLFKRNEELSGIVIIMN